jgi:hypothetical protein
MRPPSLCAAILSFDPFTREVPIGINKAEGSTDCPIRVDRVYGGAGDDARRLGLTRPFLHSWRIAFTHPLTGEHIAREEPLPDDLASALERARSANGSVTVPRDLQP